MINKVLVYIKHPHVPAWNFTPEHKALLESRVAGMEVRICYNSAEFLQRLPEARAALVWHFEKPWMEAARQLKWIATPAAGRDWIDLPDTATVPVFHGRFHGMMMAESVLGAAFYFLKGFELSRHFQTRRKWARAKIAPHLKSLYRARVTFLGFGRVGTALAKAMKPFGCRITGIRRTAAAPPDFFTEADRILSPDDLSAVLPETDILIFVLPGGEATQGLFTREHFQLLPPACLLVNVGRGNVYKEADLVQALKEGKVAGAYLDVFETEPLAETSPLWECGNVLIQPHLSAASPQYLEWFVEELAERIRAGEVPWPGGRG
ncbi:MAG: hydroxyacid dehydrogenase [Nitrospinae bacterium CG11_big_fil_rev_8_21_14_0_20_56_8]|nr:MAG: hydroxyacid dehydrogenase [Nitrospinae bacterium CG11_big_fil_rev_8_21_14_0_20_56_8]